MKKYVYILLLLASVSTLATAQIKIGNYTFKDGGEYTGELKGRKPNGKGKTIYTHTFNFFYATERFNQRTQF